MARQLMISDLHPRNYTTNQLARATGSLRAGAPTTMREPLFTSRFTNARSFEFEFDWSPDYINASITRNRDTYHIKFGLGLLSHLMALADWALEDKYIREALLLPNCYPNSNVGNHFLAIWFDWIVWHEVGHASSGHLDLSEATALESIVELEQIGESKTIGSDMLLRRAMEADADVAALNFFAIDLAHRVRTGSAKRIYGSLYASPYLFDLGASFALLFSFWQQLNVEKSLSTHPSIGERATLMSVYLAEALGIYLKGEASECVEDYLRGYSKMIYCLGNDGTALLSEQRTATDKLTGYQHELRVCGIEGKRQMRLPVDFLKRT